MTSTSLMTQHNVLTFDAADPSSGSHAATLGGVVEQEASTQHSIAGIKLCERFTFWSAEAMFRALLPRYLLHAEILDVVETAHGLFDAETRRWP